MNEAGHEEDGARKKYDVKGDGGNDRHVKDDERNGHMKDDDVYIEVLDKLRMRLK